MARPWTPVVQQRHRPRLVIGVVITAVFVQELVILTQTYRRRRARSRQVSCARPGRSG